MIVNKLFALNFVVSLIIFFLFKMFGDSGIGAGFALIGYTFIGAIPVPLVSIITGKIKWSQALFVYIGGIFIIFLSIFLRGFGFTF